MFLQNYYKLLKAFYSTDFYSSPLVSDIIGRDGSTYSVSVYANSSRNAMFRFAAPYNSSSNPNGFGDIRFISNGTTTYYDSSNVSSQPWGIIVGDGETTPAFSDYNLSGNQITDFTATTAISVNITSDHKIEVIGTYNITNTGASAFTIKEIGLVVKGNLGEPILVTRDLLATPVTIAPNDTGVITYKIEVS